MACSEWRRKASTLLASAGLAVALTLEAGPLLVDGQSEHPTRKRAKEPVPENLYQWHGALMWLSFGLLLPVAIMVARYGKSWGNYWFRMHVSIQVLVLLLATVGTGVAVRNFDAMDSTHGQVGVAIVVLVWLQPFIALARPKRGTELRPVWFVIHWVIGTLSAILGIYNIYSGMDKYGQDWDHNLKTLNVAYSISVALIVFLYLLLERTDYIRAQKTHETTVFDQMDNQLKLIEARRQLQRSNTGFTEYRGGGQDFARSDTGFTEYRGGGGQQFARTDTGFSDYSGHGAGGPGGGGGGQHHNNHLTRTDTGFSDTMSDRY